jgi:polar amino acid transport system substrate-binding protein
MKFFSCLVIFLGISFFANAVEIKAIYQENYPKYFYSQENPKKIDGICIRIMDAIHKNDPSIKFTASPILFPFKRIHSFLKKGKIDVFFGLTYKKEREAYLQYIKKPIYTVQHLIAVKADNPIQIHSFDDLRKIPNHIIYSNYGTSTAKFLKKQGGLYIDDSGRTLQENLRKILTVGRWKNRFAYMHSLSMIHTIKKFYPNGEIRILPTAFHQYSHYVAFSKKVPISVVKQVEHAFNQEEKNGDLKKIRDLYFKLPKFSNIKKKKNH